MERRWSQRKPLMQEVLLNYPSLGLLRCKTQDISLEGAFIETGRVSIPNNSDVELIFSQIDAHYSEDIRFGARVVRRNPEGIAVSFNIYQGGAYQYLWQLIMA